jgi:formylglycine-generating enzyme required for sulfatase activity/dienelactone hydrolase
MVGQTVSHYQIVEELGGGGMGVVYKAIDLRLNRPVALKFLAPSLTKDPEANARFRQEAQAASALDHPNICTIHEIDETPDHALFMVMAYYDGETLKKKIERGPIPASEAIDIGTQVARALARAHESGLIHRDIKPANLMVTRDGLAKILDFGLVKLTGQSELTTTGTTLGTVAYMSPEQIRGDDLDARTDVWSLGVVLYEMLAGRRPFTGRDDLAVVNSILNTPMPPLTVAAGVPPAIPSIVSRALEKDRDRRYGDGGEILAALTPQTSHAADRRSVMRRPAVLAAAVLTLAAVGVAAGMMYRSSARARWARETALPQIAKFIDADDDASAFALAKEVDRVIPNDPALAKLWPQFSAAGSISTTPDGADVYYEPYDRAPDGWEYLGRTPVTVRLPIGSFRFKIDKPGFTTRILASPNPGILLDDLGRKPGPATDPGPPFEIRLTPTSETSGMVAIPGGAFPVGLSGFNTDDDVPIAAFNMDAYEVTNRAFRRFVDGGGYMNPEYWRDLNLPAGDAATVFRDSTGRPGPSTWEVGAYPAGQDDFPVAGVSWYEAVAYCRSQHQTLPTLFHWARAALSPVEIATPLAPSIIPLSNFSRKSVARVGEYRAIGPYGTYDMGGNVREWVSNEAPGERRWNLGGAWSDESWLFVVPNSIPPTDRSPVNGFRCARIDGSIPAALTRAVALAPPRTKPVSAEIYQVFKRQLDYARVPVDVRVQARDTSNPDWIKEQILVAPRGSGTPVPAYLFLPKEASGPFQVAIFFPGLGDFVGRTPSSQIVPGGANFIIKTGRALIYPVWAGSYERWDPFLTMKGDEYLRSFRARMADWRQDLGRILDGVAARPDLDANRVAYLGVSFGSSTAFPLLALEDRLKAAVLIAPGYPYRMLPPEADAVNYAPHVTIPVLMMGGRHDYVLPLETSQKPMFDDLGTRPEDKRHVVYDAGHMNYPRSDSIRETLAWLDKYLGPVQAH